MKFVQTRRMVRTNGSYWTECVRKRGQITWSLCCLTRDARHCQMGNRSSWKVLGWQIDRILGWCSRPCLSDFESNELFHFCFCLCLFQRRRQLFWKPQTCRTHLHLSCRRAPLFIANRTRTCGKIWWTLGNTQPDKLTPSMHTGTVFKNACWNDKDLNYQQARISYFSFLRLRCSFVFFSWKVLLSLSGGVFDKTLEFLRTTQMRSAATYNIPRAQVEASRVR